MVVTTVSHCFCTILEGARFYDDGERLGGGLPRGCTWRARSSQGRTSPPRGCSQGCSLPGTGSPQEPFPGGSPCLYLGRRSPGLGFRQGLNQQVDPELQQLGWWTPATSAER